MAKDPNLKEVWKTGFGKEWGSLAQGDKRTAAIGINTLQVLRPDQLLLIPNDRVVTYANITVDYRPQKEDPNRVRITAGGNLIIYPGKLTTRTAHHQNVRPIYLHTKESPLFLLRAPKPSDLRGCVGKTLAGYKHGRPLPVLPRIRSRLPSGLPLNGVPHGGVPSQQ